MNQGVNSLNSLISHPSDDIPEWLAKSRAFTGREKSELSELSPPPPASRSQLRAEPECEKSELSPQEKVIELHRWLSLGVIADTHKRGTPIEIRDGEMIIDGPKFVRRCLARVDAGEPGPNTYERLAKYHDHLVAMLKGQQT